MILSSYFRSQKVVIAIAASCLCSFAAIGAASGLFSSPNDVHFPSGPIGKLVTISGVLHDQFGAPIIDPVLVSATQGDFTSTVGAAPSLLGEVEAVVTIQGLVPARPISVTIWTQPGVSGSPTKGDIFADPSRGSAIFFRGGATRVGGDLVLDLGTLQEALPPKVGEVDVLCSVTVPAKVVFEVPHWGDGPFESHLSQTEPISPIPSHLDFYSWGGQPNRLRVALVSDQFGRIGETLLLPGGQNQITTCGAGKVQGTVSVTTYPGADFVLARPWGETFPQGPDPTINAFNQLDDFIFERTGSVDTGSFAIDGLSPGNYILELWDSSVTSSPVALVPASVSSYQTSTASF